MNRIETALEAYEKSIETMKEAQAVLVAAMREEYVSSHRKYDHCRLIHEATSIAPSWVSQVLSGKREPKMPEAVLRLAKGMLAIEEMEKSDK